MRRRGFTLVEVVVVVFLIVILIGLMLPSTQKIRDDSVRSQTNMNLKQCALAVHNYHDTYRRLPDGFATGGIHATQEKSLWFHLLPYVEADNVYKSAVGAVQQGSVISSYNAPSDLFNADNAGVVNFAANVRVFGYGTLTADKVNEPGIAIDVPEGTLVSNLTLSRIVDGTTNVIMLTTRYSDCAGKKTYYAADVHGTNMIADEKGDNRFPPSQGVGGFMGAGSHNSPPKGNNAPVTAMFQIAPTVNGCVPQPALFGHSFGNWGISTALCDASVKNISPTMSPTTFSRALCPGDKLELGKDWADE